MGHTAIHGGDNQSASLFMAVLDVGSSHLVTLVASPAVGDGMALIREAEADLWILLDSIRFTPTVENIVIQPLPISYAGETGALQTGMMSFTHPKNWYIFSLRGNVIITNTNQLAINAPAMGQVQVQVVSPDYNLTGFASVEDIVGCSIPEEIIAGVTPQAVLERYILSPERIERYAEQGTTYTQPQMTRIGDKMMAYMSLFASDRDVFVIAVDLGWGQRHQFDSECGTESNQPLHIRFIFDSRLIPL